MTFWGFGVMSQPRRANRLPPAGAAPPPDPQAQQLQELMVKLDIADKEATIKSKEAKAARDIVETESQQRIWIHPVAPAISWGAIPCAMKPLKPIWFDRP